VHIANETVVASIGQLRPFHPFFGITFLVCKKAKLPVGKKAHFNIDDTTNRFLQAFYKPDYTSAHFFHPFETSGSKGGWVSPRYASTGLQSSRTREFKEAFLHPRGTDLWGWEANYVGFLADKLSSEKRGPVPAFWLAVWLFRDQEWPSDAVPELLISTFSRTS
jgi:hypothetical protein